MTDMAFPEVIATGTSSDDDMSVISYGSTKMTASPEIMEQLEASLVSLDPPDELGLGAGASRWDSSSNLNCSNQPPSRNCIRKSRRRAANREIPQRNANLSHNSTTSLLSNSSHGLSKLRRSMSRLDYNHNPAEAMEELLSPQKTAKRSSFFAPPTRPERVDNFSPGQIQGRAEGVL